MSTNNNSANLDQEYTNTIKNKSIEIQDRMSAVQKNLVTIEVEGNAGGDMVKITLNGHYEAKKVIIDPTLLTQPIQILSDLVAAAITDATRKVEAAVQNEMLSLFKGIDIPNFDTVKK
jgi:DNA-binding YbaB/EbfC family protein